MIKLLMGDCKDQLSNVADQSVDLVFTSPPYADRRKNCYESITADEYVDWFLPIAEQIKRVLKPTGSFFLNLKAHTDKGERDLYVMELVIALKKQTGFKFVDEFCWSKNAFPGGFKGRFKNGFEPIYHFTISSPSDITFNATAMGKPIKDETIARTMRKQCGEPDNGSGMAGTDHTNMRNLKIGRPSNVIHVNNVINQYSDNKEHPATFPEGLVEFFVKSFTNEGDLVLDPFMGSGTTGLVSKKFGRDFIGIELDHNYYDMCSKRIIGFATLGDLV